MSYRRETFLNKLSKYLDLKNDNFINCNDKATVY